MQKVQVYTEDLQTQLELFLANISKDSFFNFGFEEICTSEKIAFHLFHCAYAISFSYSLKIKTLKNGKMALTVEWLVLKEDEKLLDENPLLHDAGLLEMLLYGIRTLIFIGNFFNLKQLSFRLLQDQADSVMYFNKIFTSIRDVYVKDQIFTTFKMVLNTGLENYFILRQQTIIERIYQHLWSLQKSDPLIREYFLQKR